MERRPRARAGRVVRKVVRAPTAWLDRAPQPWPFPAGPWRGGRGVPRGDCGHGKDAGRAEPLLHAPGSGLAAAPRARGNLRPPARALHLDRQPPLRPRGPSPEPRPCPPAPARPHLHGPPWPCPGRRAPLSCPAPRASRAGPPAPSRLRPEWTPSAAPRAPTPRAPLPPPQPPPPRSLPLP